MTGISQNAKNGNLPEFGDAIATASKALCGFTEAAAQVISLRGPQSSSRAPCPCSLRKDINQDASADSGCPAVGREMSSELLNTSGSGGGNSWVCLH